MPMFGHLYEDFPECSVPKSMVFFDSLGLKPKLCYLKFSLIILKATLSLKPHETSIFDGYLKLIIYIYI